jgi:hypothetical protein
MDLIVHADQRLFENDEYRDELFLMVWLADTRLCRCLDNSYRLVDTKGPANKNTLATARASALLPSCACSIPYPISTKQTPKKTSVATSMDIGQSLLQPAAGGIQ